MKLQEVTTVSASSISKFLTCPRKWWLRYVLGEKGPETPAMRHGTAVHADIEAYFRGEKEAPTMPEGVEAMANGLFPPRDRVYGIELKAEDLGLKLHGLDFLGFLDLVYIDENGKLAVIDWKTRSRFTYAPDAVALLDDIQARLYAWIGFEIATDQDQIAFTHGNMIRVDGKRGRNSPRSMAVKAVFERDPVYEWIEGPAKTIVHEMREVAAKTHPREVRQEIGSDSCFKYGPCEYKDNPIASLRGRSCYDIPYKPRRKKKTGNPFEPQKKESSMGLVDLRRTKKTEATQPKPQSEVTITHSGPVEKTESDLVPEVSTGLEKAKADFLADKPDFSMIDYGLSHVEKRDFILWRKEITEKRQAEEAENPAPPVNPPDAAPDEEPVDLDEQSVFDFDFEGVDGIGAKTVENIQEFLAVEGIEDLADLLDMNLRKINGIGAKGEANLKAAIRKEKNWTPEGDASAESKEAPDSVSAQRAQTPGGAYDQENAFAEAKAMVLDDPQPGLVSWNAALNDILGRMTGQTRAAFDSWCEEHQAAQGPEPTGNLEGDAPEAPTSSKLTAKIEFDTTALQNVLYIDCRPTKGAHATSLDDLLEPAKATVCEEEGFRYWSADKYGKGRKILIDVVLEDPSFLVGHVYARSAGEGMDQLLPEIRQFFDLVIEA